MKISKKIYILLFVTFISVTISCYFVFGSTFSWFWYLSPVIFPLILTFLSTTIAFLISSVIKGQFLRSFFYKCFYYCHIIILGLGLTYIFSIYYNNRNYWKVDNITHNENYKKFFGDNRDTNVELAINAIEKKQTDIGVYRIYRMRVIEKDTQQDGRNSKYYDIHQIYFTDKFHTDTNTFVSRHLIFENKQIKEIYNKPFLKDLTGRLELANCEAQIKEMFKDKTFDSLQKSIDDFTLDIIKLTE